MKRPAGFPREDLSSNRISDAVTARPTIRAIQVPFDTTRPLNLTSHIHGGRLHKTRGHGAHLALPVDRLRGSRFDQPRRAAFNLDLWLDRDHLVVFPRRSGFPLSLSDPGQHPAQTTHTRLGAKLRRTDDGARHEPSYHRHPRFSHWLFSRYPHHAYYFASAENQWGEFVIPHLPAWLLPSNDGLAMTWFFEGLPPDEPAPWAILFDA